MGCYSDDRRRPDETHETKHNEEIKHTLNTISGGFSG